VKTVTRLDGSVTDGTAGPNAPVGAPPPEPLPDPDPDPDPEPEPLPEPLPGPPLVLEVLVVTVTPLLVEDVVLELAMMQDAHEICGTA
jgi:hypothetical protein